MRTLAEDLKAAKAKAEKKSGPLYRWVCPSCKAEDPGRDCRGCGGHGYRWTGADGKPLSVSDMTDQHLGNSLRLLERRITSPQVRDCDRPWLAILTAEAGRRTGFRWRVEEGATCTFEVRTGDTDKPCGRPAVALVADKVRLTAEGGHRRVFYDRCELHREDGLKFKKVPCGGCFRTDVNLVCELRIHEIHPEHPCDSFKSEFYCYSCSDRGGLLEAFLAMLVLILTVGRVRLERWDS